MAEIGVHARGLPGLPEDYAAVPAWRFWTSASSCPVPMGLSVADMLAGNALAQGILAALVGRGIHGRGARIDTSLLEAMIDFQFRF